MAISLTFNAIIPEKSNKRYSAHTRLHEKSQLKGIQTDQTELLYSDDKKKGGRGGGRTNRSMNGVTEGCEYYEFY